MATSSKSEQTGCYVYGIFPGDVELTSDIKGVGDPPGKVSVVRQDDLAAMISPVDLSRPLGTPEDLATHKDILDASAAAVPVLPLRFGAVLTDEDAVISDLLEANHDQFADALNQLEGHAQFVVRGRYVEQNILEEVIAENRRAAELRDQIRGADPDATRNARIELGELINDAVSAKREADTRELGKRIDGRCAASVVREPTHELDAVYVALLVRVDQEREFRKAVDELAADWNGRVEFQVLGPMAAYDFVLSAEPQA